MDTHISGLSFLTESSRMLCKLDSLQDICDYTVKTIGEYTGADIAGIALCEESALVGTLLAVDTRPEIRMFVETNLGRSLKGAPIAIPQLLREKEGFNVAPWHIDVNSDRSGANVGSRFALESVYGYPLRFNGELKLVAGLVAKRGRLPSAAELVVLEAFLCQVHLALRPHLTEVEAVPEHLEDTCFQTLYHHSDAAVLLIHNNTILDCNRQVEAVFGMCREELLNKKMHSWLSVPIPPEREAKVNERFTQVLTVGPQEMNNWMVMADGIRRFVYMTMTPLQLPGGKRAIQVVARDITELKTMEEALEESKERYTELFETLSDGLIVTNAEGRIIDCNPALLKLLGYDAVTQLRGRHFSELTPREHTEAVLERHEKLPPGEFLEYEKELYACTGSRVPVWVRIWRRFDRSGTFVGDWAVVRDLSAIKRLEADANNLEKLRLLGELAAAISHEIRNPLTTVRGFLQLLLMRSAYSQEDGERFKLMISEIDHAATIITDFLDLARPTDPRRVTLPVDEMLMSLVRVFESTAIIRRIELKNDLQQGLLVRADSSQLRQVFLNLIQNAVQALPDGGKICVRARLEENYVVAEVQDNGVGISEANLQRLGRPFFTTKQGGTGLGLTTCYRIVNAHHGRIDVESQVGKGTIFKVSLPAYVEQEQTG